ncbi:Cytochrome c550 [Candidatus Terasakiella magnetica]|uniref:Cytochrome c550 n=1 Tax=Candidatus Terasakiella magnetica TaxID=1867952 RepID=A0A1C3RLB2_9PROT|nr:cytochrome c-550 PedF [Candidatus Terasakiella magnetica]SCA57979.1 Cytochrome c550 [Candidatus Terasakiella magnetica]
MFKKYLLAGLAVSMSVGLATGAFAHGDVTPQAVDTSGLPKLGEEWVDQNPFREDEKYNARAIEIGSSAYNQNCARCHGLQVISGGIAPDLRYLEADFDGDEWYIERVTNGAVRDGKVYMPKFVGTISQEGLWAIRTYIDAQPEDE